MRKLVSVLTAIVCLGSPASALPWSGTKEMNRFLAQLQDMQTPPTPLKAEIALKYTGAEKSFTDRAVLILLPGKDAKWYLELDRTGFRAIVDGSKRTSFSRLSAGSKVEKGDLGGRIGGTDLIFADLARFVVTDYREPRILDENTDEIQIGLYTLPGAPYLYRVYTIDKDLKVNVKVQYFAGRLNNLAKVRQDSDHVKLYGKWLPRRITFKDLANASETTLSLKWSPISKLDESLFEPASLGSKSPIDFPAAPNKQIGGQGG